MQRHQHHPQQPTAPRPTLTLTASYPLTAEPAGVEVSDGSDSPFGVDLPPGIYRSRFPLFGRHVYYRIDGAGHLLSARRPTAAESDEQVIAYLADLRDTTRRVPLALVSLVGA